jgi:tRNA (cmo5U34)-methyltransferase
MPLTPCQHIQNAARFIRQTAHPGANLAKMPPLLNFHRRNRELVSKEPDRIFAQPLAQVPDFAFNEDVVRVFPDMIKRSVPGYPTIVENLGVLAAQFAQPDSVLYDLGSSWAR